MRGKKVTQHVLRHTAAMRLLKAGIDTTVIALWLGQQAQVETTQVYVRSRDQATGARPDRPVNGKPGRYRPPDSLLAFLETL
jgi:integrase